MYTTFGRPENEGPLSVNVLDPVWIWAVPGIHLIQCRIHVQMTPVTLTKAEQLDLVAEHRQADGLLHCVHIVHGADNNLWFRVIQLTGNDLRVEGSVSKA